MRYLRLFALFLKSSLLVELEYRANFVTQAVLGVFWAGITFVSVALFFSHTNSLGGWTYEQALVIVGLFTLVDGVIVSFMEPNLQRIVAMVREGTMDFVLTKPVNSQFMSTLRHAKFHGLADMATGAAIVAFALSRMRYTPGPSAIAQFALMLAVALVIVYSIWLIMGALAFWFVKIDHMQELFRAIFDTARFPVSTYEGAVRILLTFILPVAFMTTFPAQAVLGQLEAQTLLLAIGMGALAFVVSAWFWRRTIRNYSSASS